MKSKLIHLTLLAVFIILVSGLIFACTSKQSIVGYWQDTQQQNLNVEFTSDGKMIIDDGEMVITGTFEIISENYIKTDTAMLGLILDIGSNTLKFQVSGDTLKLGGDNFKTLKRVHK